MVLQNRSPTHILKHACHCHTVDNTNHPFHLERSIGIGGSRPKWSSHHAGINRSTEEFHRTAREVMMPSFMFRCVVLMNHVQAQQFQSFLRTVQRVMLTGFSIVITHVVKRTSTIAPPRKFREKADLLHASQLLQFLSHDRKKLLIHLSCSGMHLHQMLRVVTHRRIHHVMDLQGNQQRNPNQHDGDGVLNNDEEAGEPHLGGASEGASHHLDGLCRRSDHGWSNACQASNQNRQRHHCERKPSLHEFTD